jgi:hypothetical protein
MPQQHDATGQARGILLRSRLCSSEREAPRREALHGAIPWHLGAICYILDDGVLAAALFPSRSRI